MGGRTVNDNGCYLFWLLFPCDSRLLRIWRGLAAQPVDDLLGLLAVGIFRRRVLEEQLVVLDRRAVLVPGRVGLAQIPVIGRVLGVLANRGDQRRLRVVVQALLDQHAAELAVRLGVRRLDLGGM